jgi:glyoxylase-like metal-dependent hydrolase (beta-lactamase superfamily II)
MEFAAGVHMIPLLTPTIPPATHTNCVAVGERELYLIDPSTPHAEERERLVAQVDCLLEFGGRVAAILLTHAHADHVGAAEFARDRFGAPIGAHAITAERLDFQVDRRLEDGEVIAIPGDPDWRLRCVLTPGHDPGHLCFFEETTRTLIAGDMVAERGTIAILPDDGGDMTAYLESLEKLRALDADQIIPGHGFIIADPEAKLRAYIDHRLAREKKIESALARGLTRIEDLLPVAYDDVDLKLWKWAEQSLRAHLARIESKNS